MENLAEYFAGQDAGTRAANDLYYSGDWAGGRPDMAKWDRLIGIEILTVDAGPLVQADQALAGLAGWSAFFPAGWWAGFRLAFIIFLQTPKFAHRYQKLAAKKNKADLIAARAKYQATQPLIDARDAALTGNPPAGEDGEAAPADAEGPIMVFELEAWQDGEYKARDAYGRRIAVAPQTVAEMGRLHNPQTNAPATHMIDSVTQLVCNHPGLENTDNWGFDVICTLCGAHFDNR